MPTTLASTAITVNYIFHFSSRSCADREVAGRSHAHAAGRHRGTGRTRLGRRDQSSRGVPLTSAAQLEHSWQCCSILSHAVVSSSPSRYPEMFARMSSQLVDVRVIPFPTAFAASTVHGGGVFSRSRRILRESSPPLSSTVPQFPASRPPSGTTQATRGSRYGAAHPSNCRSGAGLRSAIDPPPRSLGHRDPAQRGPRERRDPQAPRHGDVAS